MKTIQFLLVMLFSIIVAACGGGGGTTSDTAPPTVSLISPAKGVAGVAANAAITVSFSETMSASSITATTFTLTGASGVVAVPVDGAVTYNGTTATFTPTNNLAPMAYTATITVGVKDAAGNAMAAPYTWAFDTRVMPNDTGTTQCYEAGSDVLVACDSAGALALNPAQDGMAGRDASVAHNSFTDGNLGFSFSTVTGGCVQDNVTGLMWEVKTLDGGLRDWLKTYTNYDSTTALQKWNGVAFVAPIQADIDAATNSVGFKTSVNAQGLCGFNDWRLPNADELQSIVDYGVASTTTIDANWFPNTQYDSYWSASPDIGAANLAWDVSFINGAVNSYDRGLIPGSYVRLVRSGPSPATSRYTVSADGQEVTDNQTKLIWRRCAEGMSWDGVSATCTGVDNVFTHEEALQHAAAQAQASSTGAAWRLPNIKELSSLADKSLGAIALIEATAFPATPASLFWSASPDVGSISSAWSVSFLDGSVVVSDRSINGFTARNVRLVRAGQ